MIGSNPILMFCCAIFKVKEKCHQIKDFRYVTPVANLSVFGLSLFQYPKSNNDFNM